MMQHERADIEHEGDTWRDLLPILVTGLCTIGAILLLYWSNLP